MSVSPKPRTRAVVLTDQALEELKRALNARWLEDQRTGRLGREAQAELMGVSVATAKNMLSGAGADRASFALAFGRLGLVWSDACCDARVRDAEPAESPSIEPAPTESVPIEPMPAAPARRLGGRRSSWAR